MSALEPTAPVPKTPLNIEELRHRWVRPDLCAEALGIPESTVRAWVGQKKVKSTRVGFEVLALFDDVERMVIKLPKPRDSFEQRVMIKKMAGQVKAATARLTNLLTDTSMAEYFHQLYVYQGDVPTIDRGLWVLARRIEDFRKALGGDFYESGYRIEFIEPADLP